MWVLRHTVEYLMKAHLSSLQSTMPIEPKAMTMLTIKISWRRTEGITLQNIQKTVQKFKSKKIIKTMPGQNPKSHGSQNQEKVRTKTTNMEANISYQSASKRTRETHSQIRYGGNP